MFIMISVSLSKSHLFCIKGRFKYYIILKIFSTIKKCFEDNAILVQLSFQTGWKCFKDNKIPKQFSNLAYFRSVSRILHHIHLCLIYEAIMRHISDKYEAIMKQISIIFSKNEVLGAAIFVYCQTPKRLQLLTFRQTFAKPCIVIAKNLH